MDDKNEKQGERAIFGGCGAGQEPLGSQKTEIENSENRASKEFGTKKEYKYPTIKLLLNEEREKLLKDCCECIGEDKSRVDDHQQQIVWDILRWTLPALRIRRYLMEVVGPVINCSPEREQNKELKQK